ncbi:MAG: hypothetical protein KZQ83_01310 [gamma proteobacterium symbiont of Taylorina sp.]|nr:hypothetical protein [gamma proteobacterium symbiont of Taylorina sp.]
MEEYLVFASIGGLLFLTLFVNSVAEAYEIRQREKRIKILRIKHSLDDLSDLLEQIKPYAIPNEINELLLNEIIVRLQLIQRIDRHFKGIQALLEEAGQKSVDDNTLPDLTLKIIKTDAEFRKIMVLLRRLIKILDSSDWVAVVSYGQLKQFVSDMKIFRCEKIVQYYTDKASSSVQAKQFIKAKEDYYYVINALRMSGVSSHPRIIELHEQAEFMLQQVSAMMSDRMKNLSGLEDKNLNDKDNEQPENEKKPESETDKNSDPKE